jgi:predicted transcriptional regulator
MKVRVENESLVRDTTTGAILETDASKLNRHRAIQQALKDKEDKIDYLLERINKLEAIIERIADGQLNA